jgi:prepilin-type N-terminal cleavage/methylation domain-containing protein
MLSTIKNKRQDGFTIIEVLIVLAIAGLIMLIVFLAVPALQRNARNTQRRQDVSAILGGMSEYVDNNNGKLPAGFSGSGGDLVIGTGAAGENTVPVKLSYYDASTVKMSGTADKDSVIVETGKVCSGNGTAPGSSRSYVAEFVVEPNATQCQGS